MVSWFQELQGSLSPTEERSNKRKRSSSSDEERPKKRQRSSSSDEERPKKRAKPSDTKPPTSTPPPVASVTPNDTKLVDITTPKSLLAQFGVGLDLNTPVGRIFTILSKTQPGENLFGHYIELAELGSQLDFKSLNLTLEMFRKLARNDNDAIAENFIFAGLIASDCPVIALKDVETIVGNQH
ncbi:hypothetical protein PSACC_01280 [Paramicrosporidium saccamoebae]|uniref:Uncharacterized protein n=1 Tax=Paramicrosporidium saccamoebae TaxID=1246581 RepID=A0A2H9TMC6_9FUNG|nr:hypothetical protein PSACC_01280 [Paramicrosporidium saccamoebae]